LCCVSYKAYEKRYCDDLKYLNNPLSNTPILFFFIQMKMEECRQFNKNKSKTAGECHSAQPIFFFKI